MHRIAKKLKISKETLRTLDLRQLPAVNGGISGPRGCHSIDDRCPPGTGGVTCNSEGICPSGPASACDASFCGAC